MAPSKVITTTSRTNPDMPRQPSLCSSLSTLLADLQNQSQNCLGSMTMDDLLKNIYSSTPPQPTISSDAHAQFIGASISREGSFSLPKDLASKSVDEVWKEIVAGGGGDQRRESLLEEMTLEDFLTKAGAVREEDVGGVVNQVGVGAGIYPVDPVVIDGGGSQFPAFGNNSNFDHQRLVVVPAGGGAMRGKRRAVEEPSLDKATQRKQRRMIKNRESAARSRERKQAYTVELESMVSHLEEENARLLREEAELNKERFKQLMKNLIPVMEKQRPRRVVRRVHSMEW
ncbi:FAM135B protein [Hibiscus syriacus]|uniref:FAM135B protein n=1 Tax=Hibiscus syriacus TaxID=106335 RepID=A0A6A2Y802_HIBSY|nr:ABSCISIC ACID-INSENSITIVE 5-like protein 4 isoform X2 [Hibiscus syriacus]KAE8672896.1 FAM135B protein [Hibiscus syriacus]